MEKLNKFKIATITILCLFLFVVAAIYTSTKDVVAENMENKQAEQTTVNEDKTQTPNQQQMDENRMYSQLLNITSRLENLEQKVMNTNYNQQESTDLKCRIAGSFTNRGFEEISPDVALQNAKDNNSDIVVLCSLK